MNAEKCASDARKNRGGNESLHYFWSIDRGAKKPGAIGLCYQAEADGKTTKVSDAVQYRAIAVGDSIVICYTAEKIPDKVYFRVIQHGTLGPVCEVAVAKGRKFNLWSEDMLLYAESDRIWFVNTDARNTLYELKMVDAKKP